MYAFYIALLMAAIFTFSLAGAEDICGRVSIKNRGQNVSVILADLQSQAEPVYFQIRNPEAYQWQVGACVCARGSVACEEAENSCDFSIKKITAVDPTGQDCLPTWFP